MRLTFKNVGHGDTLLFEWKEKSINKFGIIDCNQFNNQNSIIEFLSENTTSEIEFIFLSHPHKDHYSGLLELFNYCESHNIIIKLFGHTLVNTADYIDWVDSDTRYVKKLADILDKYKELREKGIILDHVILSEGQNFKFGDYFFMDCLSPSDIEYEEFGPTVAKCLKEGISQYTLHKMSQAGNLLSTIFLIRFYSSRILITSDATVTSFERLHKKKKKLTKIIDALQVPHHGSINNLSEIFLNNLVVAEKATAIFSVGPNESFQLPDYEVVEYFDKNEYNIECTNFVYGLQEYFQSTEFEKFDDIDLISQDIFYFIKPTDVVLEYDEVKKYLRVHNLLSV